MQILLVIDVQQRYVDKYKPDLVARVNSRIEEALNKDTPIVYVRNTGSSGKDNNFEFADDLKIESDCIFNKKFPSAFTNSEFEGFLRDINAELINVVGIDGRCCVTRTVMDALSRDYRICLLTDAIEAQSDKFYYKELKDMEKAGAMVKMNLEEI